MLLVKPLETHSVQHLSTEKQSFFVYPTLEDGTKQSGFQMWEADGRKKKICESLCLLQGVHARGVLVHRCYLTYLQREREAGAENVIKTSFNKREETSNVLRSIKATDLSLEPRVRLTNETLDP